jgi:hypothetical protein
MKPDDILFFKSFFWIAFAVTLFIGFYLMKNYQKFFGVDPSVPSERSSARAYTATMVFAVWLHMLVLFGGFALWMR